MLLEVMSNIEAQPLEWVWDGVVPLGKLTLIMGEPGIGKSLVAMDTIARLTRGLRSLRSEVGDGSEGGDGGLVDGERGTPGEVILFAGEDDVSSTVRPRLDAAGADLDRVSVVQNYSTRSTYASSYERSRLDEDVTVEMLEAYLEGQKDDGEPVRLIVIDPINCYLEHIDSHQEDRVRVMASKLGDLAQRWNTAILLIAQPAKTGVGKRGAWMPTTRVFAKAARSVWLIAHDPDDGQRRLLLPIKTNLCAMPAGLGFRIQDQAILWDEEPIPISAEQYLAETTERQQIQAREPMSELMRTVEWLERRLAEAPVLSTKLRAEATANHVSGATLRRALQVLNCQKEKERCADGRWLWRLPAPQQESTDGEIEVDQLAQFEQV